MLDASGGTGFTDRQRATSGYTLVEDTEGNMIGLHSMQ